MHLIAREGLQEQPERQVGHGEAGGPAGHEQAGDTGIVQSHRHRKAGRAARKMEIDQRQVGGFLLEELERTRQILGDADHAVTGVILDHVAQHLGQWPLVLDDQDFQHLGILRMACSPAVDKVAPENVPRESRMQRVIAEVSGNGGETP